jgi:hypothetical protein
MLSCFDFYLDFKVVKTNPSRINSNMNKRKANWTCSYCSRIFKDPIVLPCGDFICGEHLLEKGAKKNKQKCNECHQEFQTADIQLNSNKGLKKLLENQPYLNEEEMSLKLELEESIRKLFQFYDEFNQNKTKRESFVSSQFEELRSQIDQHRDKLKERIDNIAFKMKNETEIYEKIYLKSLKESFTSFDQSKSLENELNEIQEQFRNPNISIQTIKEMQRTQEESLRDIQLKLGTK